MSIRTTKLKLIKFTKDFLLATRLLQLLQPFNKLFGFIYNFNLLTSWIHKHKKEGMLMNDFYKPVRNYDDRLKSFAAIRDQYRLNELPVCYLEFGVYDGGSFKWWLQQCTDPSSRFFGFDTFEGLPEDWGHFAKGEMNAAIPRIDDNRGAFIKGIFQDTLNDFIKQNEQILTEKKKVIHMDADLFSSTIFTLSQLYPLLKKGDIVMFDEFNVCNHEFMAYRIFTEAFYVKLKPISAQGNYYHAAFEVE